MIQQGFARLEVESLSSGKVHVLYPEDAEITLSHTLAVNEP